MNDSTVGLGDAVSAPKTTPATTANGSAATVAVTAKKTRGTVTADADVTAMAKISKIVNDLTLGDKATVVGWFKNKF